MGSQFGADKSVVAEVNESSEDFDDIGALPVSPARFMSRDSLEWIHFAAYSVGHFANDLTASMGFMYISWYYLEVVGLSQRITAIAFLSM